MIQEFHPFSKISESARVKRARLLWVSVALLTWLGATTIAWVGYAGADDQFYARFAYLFHRPPINWWEFRIPAILAMRASMFVFGPSEFAAAFPCLVASATIAGAVAWFVGWPRRMTWESQTTMMLVAVLPIDVAFRSTPGLP